MSSSSVFFDHIEVHVRDVPEYGSFLLALFRGGRFRQISDSGTSMFITPDGVNVEVKTAEWSEPPGSLGFRLPCIRLENARAHVEALGLEVVREISNPEGSVVFFRDGEGIEWHAKSYVHRDRYISW